MKTLSLSDQDARKIYPSAIPELKTILEANWGKSFFSQKITERVKTWEDVCREANEDPDDIIYRTGTADEIAYKKLKVIIRVLNEGWSPNWNDSSQRKWYPWFYLSSPGFRFLVTHFEFTYAIVGSRLCFKSEELCEFAAKQFTSIYKDFFTL
ncbi:MAG: hypothetical protein ACTHLE_04340 [Agriterribacter sp.]